MSSTGNGLHDDDMLHGLRVRLTSQMAEQQTREIGVDNIVRGMTIVPYEATHMYGMEKTTFMQLP